jgi:HSP20 family protein
MSAQIVNRTPVDRPVEADPFQTFFETFFGRPTTPRIAEGMAPPLDVLETEEALVVKAAMPGVQAENLEVTIEGRALTLRGETRKDEVHEDAKVYRREIARGSYARTLRLPQGLDTSKVSATVQDGLVTVTLPWSEDRKPEVVRVPVNSTGG